MVQAKRELRRRLRAARAALDVGERMREDGGISDAVAKLAVWSECRVVYAYLSFGSEVDTRSLILRAWQEGKLVALPWCVPGTRQMRWFRVNSLDGLVKSSLGVEEPVPDPTLELDGRGDTQALALVPGLAFDKRGFRLGYGAGFYDGFLAAFRGYSVGLCRHATLVDDLAELGVLEPHDRAVDLVVTE